MKKIKTINILALAGIGGLLQVTGTTVSLLSEDFEDATVAYTIDARNNNNLDPLNPPNSTTDDLSEVASGNFYGRVTQTQAGNRYGNGQGLSFYGLQDTDGFIPVEKDVDIIVLTWSNIDITNFTDLQFSGFFAEANLGGVETFDPTTSLIVEASIDGGGFANVFAIESASAGTNNLAPSVDDNFDGVGDGTLVITDQFTQYTRSISGSGSSLDLRVTVAQFDGGTENIGLDNIEVTGVAAVPEPSSVVLLGLGGVALILRRKK